MALTTDSVTTLVASSSVVESLDQCLPIKNAEEKRRKYLIGNLIISKTFYLSVKILNHLHLYIQGINLQKKRLLVANTLCSSKTKKRGELKKGFPPRKK